MTLDALLAQPSGRNALDGALGAPQLNLVPKPRDLDLAQPGSVSRVSVNASMPGLPQGAGNGAGGPRSRLSAARSWLEALGYLRKSNSTALTAKLVEATRQFQVESGLKPDGWIGPGYTWPSLHKLMAFEGEFDIADWLDQGGHIQPALRRAVAARLAVYGVVDWDRKSIPADPDIISWSDTLWHLLNVFTPGLPPLSDSLASRCHWILDHDGHIKHLSQAAGYSTLTNYMRTLNPRNQAREINSLSSFLLNLSKVELWLSQSEDITLNKVIKPRLRNKMDYAFDFGSEVISAIKQLAKDFQRYNAREPAVVELVKRLSAFRQKKRFSLIDLVAQYLIVSAKNMDDQLDQYEKQVEQIESFYKADPSGKELKLAKKTAQQITSGKISRSRQWDGFKRLWSWVRGALSWVWNTLRAALKIAKRIAGFVFRFIKKGFGLVYGALSAFVDHAGTALKRFDVDPTGSMVFTKKLDGDVNVVFFESKSQGLGALKIKQHNLSVQIMGHAASVVGRIIKFAVGLIGAAFSVGLVLRILLDLYRGANSFFNDLEAIPKLVAEYNKVTQLLAVHRSS